MSAQPPPTSERDALQLQSPTPKMELNILSPKKAKYASGKAVIVREYLEEVFVNEIQAGSIDFEVTTRLTHKEDVNDRVHFKTPGRKLTQAELLELIRRVSPSKSDAAS